jgi:hypothetical protein
VLELQPERIENVAKTELKMGLTAKARRFSGSGARRNTDGTRVSDWMRPSTTDGTSPRPARTYRCARRNEARRSYRAKARVS